MKTSKMIAITTTFFLSILLYSGCYYQLGRVNENDPKSDDYNMKPVVTVLNARDNCELNSGFLIGTVTDDKPGVAVEVQVDSGGWDTANGGSNWSYKLPSGSSTWKGNSRHTIDVRAIDSESTYSETTLSITVRKGINKDINGDGYSDLVINSMFNYVPAGTHKVYIYYGASSISTTPTVTINGPEGDPAAMYSSQFAQAVATGDINGDGYADIVVLDGVYNAVSPYDAANNQQRIYIFYSAGSGGITSKDLTSTGGDSADERIINTYVFGEPNPKQGFKSTLTTGDFNGDGYCDLAVTDTSTASENDYLHVFYSTDQGGGNYQIGATTHAGIDFTLISGTANGWGTSLVAADFNGDNYTDLAISAPHMTTNRGRVTIQYGSVSGLTNGDSESFTGANDYDYLGVALDAGDVNGDGYYDLVVGAHGYDATTDDGRVYIFYDNNSSKTLFSSTPEIITANGNMLYFGEAVSLTDLDGDGYDDLIVGASGNQVLNDANGWAYIYYSNGSTGISTTLTATITGENADDDFGVTTRTGDFNGDGFSDFTVYAQNWPIGDALIWGRVYLFDGSSSDFTNMTADNADTIFSGSASGILGAYVSFP